MNDSLIRKLNEMVIDCENDIRYHEEELEDTKTKLEAIKKVLEEVDK